MVNTTTKYIVYNHSGSGIRHHHFGIQNNIIDEADGHASPGDTITAQGFPIQFFNGNNVPFAFMSVQGGNNGNQLYTTPGNQSVPVGTNDIIITVVYAPVGGIGGPGGDPGVWVDAFNVDTGNFSDSPHILEVLTNGSVDNAKTTEANAEGDISTLSSAELIRADQTVDGIPFIQWKQIMPAQSDVNNRDVSLAKGETGEIWIAFYQTHSGGGGGGIHLPNDSYSIWQWVDYGTMVDGGPHPWTPFIAQIAAGMSMAYSAKFANGKLRSEILALAAKQVQLGAEGMSKAIKESGK